MEAKALVDMRPYTLVQMHGETLIDTLSNVLAQILVDTYAKRVLQVEVVTLAKKPGDMENEAVVDMLQQASRVAARDV